MPDDIRPRTGALVIVSLFLLAGALGACDPPAHAADGTGTVTAASLGIPAIEGLVEVMDDAPAGCAATDVDCWLAAVWGPELTPRALLLVHGPTPVRHCATGEFSDGSVWVSATHDYGPMQINRRAWRRYADAHWPGGWAAVSTDVEQNIRFGHDVVYARGGWKPWKCGRRWARGA